MMAKRDAVKAGFDGGPGRYRGRFCRRDGTVRRFSRQDGTVKRNGRDFSAGDGTYESKVGESVKVSTVRNGTGQDHGSILTTLLTSSRPVVTVNTVPSINHEKP